MKTMPKKFGMFIHWGPYSVTGWQEQYRMRRGISRSEYRRITERFKPFGGRPENWVKLAADAGAEYICFTSKHHDGYCMWNTEQTDFNIYRTTGRDILYELADACLKHDIALSIYYSIPDWNHPNAYNEKSSHQCPPEAGDKPDDMKYREFVRAQTKELLTGYGDIYTWFWDIPPRVYDPSMNEYLRELQPDLLINDRGWSEGDFSTPERTVPEGDEFPGYTEACQSVGANSWGYRQNEDYYTPSFIVRSMDKIMLMGGSYLLNVGPDADGVIPKEAADIFLACGEWYKKVKEAYFESAAINELSSPLFFTNGGDGRYYIHVNTPLISSGLNLSPFCSLPESVTLLNTGKAVDFCLEPYPGDFTGCFGEMKPPSLRLRNLEPNTDGMPMIFRLYFG